MIQFTKGSQLWIEKSMGFKNDDVYCVAPVIAGHNVPSTNETGWAQHRTAGLLDRVEGGV
jgi:hypothetical protein